MSRCPKEKLVDAHFSGAISTDGEKEMRSHLDGCAGCRERYDRQLIFASLDPNALSAKERLGRGLGVREPRARFWTWALAGSAAVALAMIAAMLVPGEDTQNKLFFARGSRADGPSVRLDIFTVGADKKPAAAKGELRPTDELAFAYLNRAGKKHLLVFAVSDDRQVYWYHPAWRDPQKNPTAITIRSGAKLHELPEAISHPLKGKSLTVFGVFVDRPLSVRDVEQSIQKSKHGRPNITGALVVERRLGLRR